MSRVTRLSYAGSSDDILEQKQAISLLMTLAVWKPSKLYNIEYPDNEGKLVEIDANINQRGNKCYSKLDCKPKVFADDDYVCSFCRKMHGIHDQVHTAIERTSNNSKD